MRKKLIFYGAFISIVPFAVICDTVVWLIIGNTSDNVAAIVEFAATIVGLFLVNRLEGILWPEARALEEAWKEERRRRP